MIIDSYTKLLLHCNGTDASTSFPDASPSGHTVTANGDAHVEVDQSKFGGASAQFDGTGDYLSVPNNSDWDFGTGDYTVDCWVWRNGDQANYAGLVAGASSSSVKWILSFMDNPGNTNKWRFYDGTDQAASSSTISNQTWTHIAAVRYGNTLTIYQGGASVGTADCTGNTVNSAGTGLAIGRLFTDSDSYYFNGYIDESRISKGIARWTSNFTPPARPYHAAFSIGGGGGVCSGPSAFGSA